MRTDELLRPWYDAAAEMVPGMRLFDVHTHTGHADPDEFHQSPEELLGVLAQVHGRAAVFTLHEPGGYSGPNERVLAEAAASGGKLVPFCRVDPHVDAVAEARRCLDAGARGIKLHPRAERFTLDHPAVGDLFELAEERSVPIIVHAGRGIPALGRHTLEQAERHPGANVILAHAGICDLAWLWRHGEERTNLLYDSAWWTATDLIALFSLVPPGRILFGSDSPYATPLHGSILTLRCARHAGLSAQQLQAIMGGQLERLLAGEPLLDLGPAPMKPAEADIHLDRAYTFLIQAIIACFGRVMSRVGEALSLVRLCCEVGDEAPQAEACASVLSLVDRFERYQAVRAEDSRDFGGVALLIVAAVVAKTPAVPLPAAPEPVSVSERTD
ncbi:MAG: amidohydrolase family protein [Thermoleophilaceae bacterium]